MASEKLSSLTSLAGGQVPTDLAYVVDVSATVNGSKKSTLNDLFAEVTKNITDGALRFGGFSAPALSGAGKGSIYFDSTSNTFKVSENGAAYQNLVGGGGGSFYPLTPIVNGDFSWFNQGTASLTINTKGAAILKAPTNTGDALRIREKAYPATPFTLIFGFIPLVPTANFYTLGMCIRDSVGGAIASFGVGASNGAYNFNGVKWTNSTTFSANYYQQTFIPHNGMIFIKYEDNGTNRIISYGIDGEVFAQVFSVSRTDFLTPDRIGFMANVNNATYEGILGVYSWAQS